MRVIVTGAAGFLGSHLCESLISHGHEVAAIDDMFRGKKANLDSCKGMPDFYFVSGDCANMALLEKAREKLGGVDIIYHLAAINGTKLFHERPDLVIRVNLATTQTVLAFCANEGCRLVFTSSPEAFGEIERMPLAVDSNSMFTPASSHFRHSYGGSKYLCEILVNHGVKERSIDARIVRPFNGYGPRLRGDAYGQVVSIFLDQCHRGGPVTVHGDGSQTRSFTWVEDIISGIRQCGELESGLDGSKLAGRSFNIGNPEEISIADLAAACVDVSGEDIVLVNEDGHPGDSARRLPDISDAEAALGWSPTVSLRDGLERCWAWLVTEREAQAY
jgi:UDP-glucose 4-epimerase